MPNDRGLGRVEMKLCSVGYFMIRQIVYWLYISIRPKSPCVWDYLTAEMSGNKPRKPTKGYIVSW